MDQEGLVKLNGILPPFVNLGELGLNYGMQGAQFTAVSTTAENQTLSNSMYVHSIPNNNDNQDVVSMGTNAALLTKRIIENTFEVVAIEMMTIVQAIEYLNIQNEVSSKTKWLYDEIRKLVPPFKKDEEGKQRCFLVFLVSFFLFLASRRRMCLFLS